MEGDGKPLIPPISPIRIIRTAATEAIGKPLTSLIPLIKGSSSRGFERNCPCSTLKSPLDAKAMTDAAFGTDYASGLGSLARCERSAGEGPGYEHPELVAAFMRTAAQDIHTAMMKTTAQDLRDVLEGAWESA